MVTAGLGSSLKSARSAVRLHPTANRAAGRPATPRLASRLAFLSLACYLSRASRRQCRGCARSVITSVTPGAGNESGSGDADSVAAIVPLDGLAAVGQLLGEVRFQEPPDCLGLLPVDGR